MPAKLAVLAYPGNKGAFKALIVAEMTGVQVEAPRFQMGTDNKAPAFLAINPIGKVPALSIDGGKGGGVFESNAMARYVARLTPAGAALLGGADPLTAAHVDQWVDFLTNELDTPILAWFLPAAGMRTEAECGTAPAAIARVERGMAVLDAVLRERTFLVGDAVTLADIVGAASLWLGFTKLFEPALVAKYPNVARYYDTLAHQPAFEKVMGEVVYAKAGALAAVAEDAKKAAAAASAPAPVPAPAGAAAADPSDPSAPAAPKPKNPLDLLPPSTMALDAYKRLYSNTPAAQFKEIAVEGLWKGAAVPNSPTQEVFPGFDPEGFSLWSCDYKYPEENTVNYVVMNKVGGFLQRIDYARKYAFGVMCILKDGDTFPIRGFWIFRGQGIPPQMVEECYDLDLYNWAKLDWPIDEKTKARIGDMLAEEEKIDGLEHVECKVFK
jgi:elongation factor 1-gamma